MRPRSPGMLPTAVEIVRPRPSTVGFGPFTFDRANGLLRHGTQEIPLPPRVLAVLDLLIARAGELVPRQELIDSVWKEAFVTDTSLAEAVSVLRQALGDDPQTPSYVQTVHRRGYRFVAHVAPLTPAIPVSEPAQSASPAVDRVSPSIGGQLVPWGVALLSGILAVTTVWQYTHRRTAVSPVVRVRIEPAAGTFFDSRAPALALSPDGLVVAWSGCDGACRLYVRGVDQLDPQVVPGTDGASAPFFSPDGRWIGFFGNGKLWKVALAGGMPIALAEAAQPFGAVWTADSAIVFAASEHGGLLRVSDRGGDAEPLTIPSADAGEVRHAWPALAPGGRALLFTISTSPAEGATGRIAMIPDGQHEGWQTVIESGDVARAASQDYLLFSRANEIHAVAFDRARQTLSGPAEVVVSSIAPAQFAVSQSGAIVYAAAPDAPRPALEWMPRAEGSTLSADLAALGAPTLSPDGSRVAGVGGSDIWAGDIVRGTTTRLTHGGRNATPVWSADGAAVYFASASSGPFETWTRDSSGGSPPRRVLSAAVRHRHTFPSSMSADAQLLAYTESGGPARGDVIVIALATGIPIAAVRTPFDETNGMLSPDGRLLAYQSDESGRWEIYLLRIADQRRLSISSSGGTTPMWKPAGRGLLYRAGDALMTVPIEAATGPIGPAVELAALTGVRLAGIAPDGRMLVRRNGDVALHRAALTIEWARELRKMLGPPASTLPR